MNDLSQRLKDGVPAPPGPGELGGIGARAAATGRRRRTQRRLASVAAAAVAVVAAGGLLLPRVLGDGPPDVAERSEPQCVASADAPVERIGSTTATWVRFCELDEPGQVARFPRGVVTGDRAAALVQGWADWVVDSRCRPETPAVPSRLFRIQVGLADGSVTEIEGDTGCVDGHLLLMQLETPLLMGEGIRRDEVVPPRTITCPDGLDPTAVGRDGARAGLLGATDETLGSVPLLPGQVSATDVCAYAGQGDDRVLVDQWRAESVVDIRSTATTGYTDGVVDCDPQPDATSYVVVMQDLTGTARAFTLDMAACGEMRAAIGTPAVDTYLGVASDELVRVVRDSRP